MGVKEEWFDRVVPEHPRHGGHQEAGQPAGHHRPADGAVMPQLRRSDHAAGALGKELRPDYLVIKHCSDDEDGSLGVDYDGVRQALRHACTRPRPFRRRVQGRGEVVEDRGQGQAQLSALLRRRRSCSRSPARAWSRPAACSSTSATRRFHIGNICEQRFKDIWAIDRYWEVVNHLASPEFNAQKMCGIAVPAAQGQRVPRRLQEGAARPPGAHRAPAAAPRLHLGKAPPSSRASPSSSRP